MTARTESNSSSYCDESKCVSRELSQLFNDSFTCFGSSGDENTFFPQMCADGYFPTAIHGEWEARDYFTCCPPGNSYQHEQQQQQQQEAAAIAQHAQRHCSDPIIMDSITTTTVDINNDLNSSTTGRFAKLKTTITTIR